MPSTKVFSDQYVSNLGGHANMALSTVVAMGGYDQITVSGIVKMKSGSSTPTLLFTVEFSTDGVVWRNISDALQITWEDALGFVTGTLADAPYAYARVRAECSAGTNAEFLFDAWLGLSHVSEA